MYKNEKKTNYGLLTTKYRFFLFFYAFPSCLQATAATSAAPRPEPSSDNIRSKLISGRTSCRIFSVIKL